MRYQHTQTVPGKVMTLATLAGLAVGLTPPGIVARLALLGTLGAVGAIFRTLTVAVTDDDVELSFGKGVLKRSFALSEVSSVTTVRTTPLQGWGIHYVGGGWLYNVFGLDAVEICFHDGKRALIGSDEPERLAAAIQENRQRLKESSTKQKQDSTKEEGDDKNG